MASLADHFLDSHELSPEAQARLLAYHWPGNVRELENAIKRGILLNSGGPITPEQLGLQLAELAKSAGHEPDADDIRSALSSYDGVVSRAARSLGLSRQALYRRMAKYGLK